MEGFLVKCINDFMEMGYATISLGLAPNTTFQNTKIQQISQFLNLNFSSGGLRNFKQKFSPDWDSRYLISEGLDTLPIVLTELKKILFGEVSK